MSKKSTVYFVDDDPIILKLIQFYLRDQELDLHTFVKPELLFEDLSTGNRPDLIVSDITLGKMNGIDMVSQIREQYPTIQCAFCSAYINLEMAMQVNNLNNDDLMDTPYYSKPFQMPGLMEFISSHLPNKSEVTAD